MYVWSSLKMKSVEELKEYIEEKFKDDKNIELDFGYNSQNTGTGELTVQVLVNYDGGEE